MPNYAVTITPNRYKRFSKSCYKDLSDLQQRTLILEHIKSFDSLQDMLISFEFNKHGDIHAHLHIQCDEETIEFIISKTYNVFGYNNNPLHYIILVKTIINSKGYDIWIDYMYKDYSIKL